MAGKNKEVSAQVIMKPADRVVSDKPVTSENVRRRMPKEDDVRKAASHFEKLGFRVENVFGNSFSITGDAKLFEKAFKTKLSADERGGLKASRRSGEKSLELSTSDLPDEIGEAVEAVTFSEPPDFGPGNF